MKLSHALAVAGLLAFPGIAFAGPSVPPQSALPDAGIVKVHGDHRACEPGQYGWHRHNRYGERIPCAPRAERHERYEEYRPVRPRNCTRDWHCVKTGPFGIEKRCYWRDLCH